MTSLTSDMQRHQVLDEYENIPETKKSKNRGQYLNEDLIDENMEDLGDELHEEVDLDAELLDESP